MASSWGLNSAPKVLCGQRPLVFLGGSQGVRLLDHTWLCDAQTSPEYWFAAVVFPVLRALVLILSLFYVSLSLSKVAVGIFRKHSPSLFFPSLDTSVCGDIFPLAWKCFRNETGRCFCQAPVPFRNTEPKEAWP